jgi:peptidoglycan/LPS O-acetylase OafA/YrhL
MEYKSGKYIPALDGLRAYAVLMVCVGHFFQINETNLYQTNKSLGILLFKTSQIGLHGVELFFILSGFLITGILLDSKTSSKYFSSFYARRFLRISPLYYFVLFLSFFILPKFCEIDTAGIELKKQQLWLWTYTQNLSWMWGIRGWDSSLYFPWFGHFWSLCVEEHFYLLWPLIIYVLSEKMLPKIMWLIVLLSVFSMFYVNLYDFAPILRWTSIQYSGILSVGGLIAWYSRQPEKPNLFRKVSLKYILLSGIIFFLVNFIPRKYEMSNFFSVIAAILFFSSLVTYSVDGSKEILRFLNHRTLYFIGKISYGIYVYHGLIRPFTKILLYDNFLSKISNAILSHLLYTVICTSISVLIAWISWNFIESPFIKIKKIFVY